MQTKEFHFGKHESHSIYTMLRIVESQNEKYKEAIKLIVDSCRRSSVPVETIEIETLKNTLFKETDIVFFLTNDQRVGLLAANLSSQGVRVINGTYLIGNRTKSYTHQQVRVAGIRMPRFVSGINLKQLEIDKDISELGFPLYVKSERHVYGVFKAENATELGRIIAGLNPSIGWYFEADVDAPDRHLEKIYWITGSCFGRDGKRYPHADVVKAMDITGKTLSFDAFSADFILNESRYWCIDVNPAPALFGSETAREAFVSFVRSHLARKNKSFAHIYRQSIKRRNGLKPFVLHKMERSAGALVRRLQRNLPKHASILEIGAGTAAISTLLALRGFDVTAIDYDENILPMMRASLKAFRVEGKIRFADGFELEKTFARNIFDCAISHGVMEHYNDIDIIRLLRAQLAVAKHVAFVVPTATMSEKYRRRGLGDERFLMTREWRTILGQAGFKVRATYGFGSKETNHLRFPETFWRWNLTARILASFAAFNEFWIESS